MASETTLSTDLVIPEVFGDTIGPEITGQLVMANVADVDDTLAGRPGDEVTFVRFDYIGPADTLTEGVPMETRKLSTSSAKARIKEAGTAIEITDTAILTALGQPVSIARQNLALSVADRIDADLRTAAERVETIDGTTYQPLSVAASDEPLSWNRLTYAFGLLGDRFDPALLSLVISSGQHMQLLRDENFQSADKFGAGAVLLRGQVGAIGNIRVFVSDRATAVADADAAEAGNQPGTRALLIRRGALALKYKRRPVVETGRDILKRTDVLTTNVHYATKRVDDKGVIVIPTGA